MAAAKRGRAPAIRRILLWLGWAGAAVGLVGLVGIGAFAGDVPMLVGCTPRGFLGIACPEDPRGWLMQILWFAGIVALVWFPGTLVALIFGVVWPLARLIVRRRAAAAAARSAV